MLDDIIDEIVGGLIVGAGIAIGSYLLSKYFKNDESDVEQQRFYISLVCQTSLCITVARADGKVSNDKIDVMVKLLSEMNGLGDKGYDIISRMIKQINRSEIDLLHTIDIINKTFDFKTKSSIFLLLFYIAHVDGEFDFNEKMIIKQIQKYLKIPNELFARYEKQAYEYFNNNANASIYNAYYIFELDSSASVDDIKKMYRLKVQKNHPDKVSHLGHEFVEIAKIKFLEIQKAYDVLKEYHNFV